MKQIDRKIDLEDHLFYGFYPRTYKSNINPTRFYRDYVETYIQRDIKLLVNIKDTIQFERLLKVCATRVGHTIDYTSLANELGLSRHTVKEWISILKASFIITLLPPYFENLGKRVIKSSKLYFNDPGLTCYLLDIHDKSQLSHHPLRGPLFENFIINEISKEHLNKGNNTSLYFYRDSNQVEVDLIFPNGLSLVAIEIKSSKTFHKSFLKGLMNFKKLPSMHSIDPYVVYSGSHQQKVHDVSIVNYAHMNEHIPINN